MWNWNKEEFEERMRKENVEYRFWGNHGLQYISELENALNFTFNEEARSFIENIGNLDLGSDDIIFTGSSKARSCVTESENVGLLDPSCPIKGVKIMDRNGVSYVLLEDGSIKEYDYKFIDPEGELSSFESLSDLMDTLIKEIKAE